MGVINDLRDPDQHGLTGITMRYEEGGLVQVYKMGDKEVRFGPDATISEIVATFKDDK